MSEEDTIEEMVATWRSILPSEGGSWVLFEHGTCVLFKASEPDIEMQAKEILEKWGPVVPGTNLGDFNVVDLEAVSGWIVTYAHPGVVNYVSPSEVEAEQPSDPDAPDYMFRAAIGLTGREKRRQDAESLKIIHVEEKTA